MIATEFSAPNVWTGPGPFLEQFLGHVLLRLGSKNMQKPSKKRLYVLFAYKIYISQQAENRVNTSTSVFARRWLKYTANTMHFTTKGKLFRKPSKIAKTQPM